MASEFTKQIWEGLFADIKRAVGVAGLMGNLQAESGLIPYRLQNDFSEGYADSLTYTEQVNNGTISESEFVNRALGYGLAQWTFYSRKQGLYDMKKSMGVSIGSVELGVAYLLHELKNDFPEVYRTLVNATTIEEASDIVLLKFESPKDQSESVIEERRALSRVIYNEFLGWVEEPDTPISTTKKRKKFNFLLFNKRRRII